MLKRIFGIFALFLISFCAAHASENVEDLSPEDVVNMYVETGEIVSKERLQSPTFYHNVAIGTAVFFLVLAIGSFIAGAIGSGAFALLFSFLFYSLFSTLSDGLEKKIGVLYEEISLSNVERLVNFGADNLRCFQTLNEGMDRVSLLRLEVEYSCERLDRIKDAEKAKEVAAKFIR
jgi:hypothetical protein